MTVQSYRKIYGGCCYVKKLSWPGNRTVILTVVTVISLLMVDQQIVDWWYQCVLKKNLIHNLVGFQQQCGVGFWDLWCKLTLEDQDWWLCYSNTRSFVIKFCVF